MSKRTPILLGILLLIFTVWLSVTTLPSVQHLLTRLGYLAYDVQLYTKVLTQTKKPQSPIAIIDVDEKTLFEQGRWPWPQSKLAQLIQVLQGLGAEVIAMDMTFPQPELNEAKQVEQLLVTKKASNAEVNQALEQAQPYFANDSIFAEALKKTKSVMGAVFQMDEAREYNPVPLPLLTLTDSDKQLSFFQAKGYIGNIPILQQAATSIGFINVFADEDGVIRRVPLLLRYKDGLYPSLALEASLLYLFNTPIKLISHLYGNQARLEGVEVAGHIIPTDERAQVLVPYLGKQHSFSYFSATDVLNGKMPPHSLEDKIVFLGVSAVGLGDLQTTPVQSGYPGVEIHASIANGILQNVFYNRPPWALGAEIVITIFVGSILVFVFPYLGASLLGLMTVLVPAALIFLNNFLWTSTGLVLSMLMPVLFTILLAMTNLIYGYLFESRRREQVQAIFGQYVPAKHIEEMLKSRGNFGMLGEDREMTVLFADIRNFTGISEARSASDVKELLSQYLTPMTQIIFDHRGTIDKYVGDLIMAFWGAPLEDKSHARNAIISALNMQKELVKLEPVFAKNNWPAIKIGIGLNSGLMTVGDMGSQFRRNYTVLGDSVNLASRLESLTKYYGVKIIASEFTVAGQNDFVFRLLDKVQVKGKEHGILIYEVIGERKDLSDELKNELQLSAQGLTYYFEKRWDEAERIFQRLNKEHPEVILYSLFLARIANYRAHPPEEEWNGIYRHLEK